VYSNRRLAEQVSRVNFVIQVFYKYKIPTTALSYITVHIRLIFDYFEIPLYNNHKMDMNDRDRVRFYRQKERLKQAIIEKHGSEHLRLIEEKL
jgi:hypothetical protein